MSAPTQPRLTPEQYLEIERAAEIRSDYYDGRMYELPRRNYWHSIAVGNLACELGMALKKRSCIVTTCALRLRVSPGGLHTYPDVIVVCGDPVCADNHDDILINPTLVAEVLSASSEAYDRGFKSAQYRTIESLQEYVLVWQAEPRVEVYQRQSAGRWLLSEFIGLEAVCRFESLDCTATLARLYHNVSFDPGDEAGSILSE